MQRAFHRPDGCCSDFVLDRLIAGELDEPARAAVFAHADGCAWCSARIAEFRGAQQRVAAAPVPLALHRRRSGRMLGLGATFAVAAALAVVIVLPDDDASGVAEEVRSKGAGHLDLYVERGDGLWPLSSGERIAPGARVQPTWTAAVSGHLAIFGVDGAGRVQRHFPLKEDRGAFVRAGRDAPLPFSLRFDATPGREVLLAVFCPGPIDLEALERRIGADGALDGEKDCSVDRVELSKDRG